LRKKWRFLNGTNKPFNTSAADTDHPAQAQIVAINNKKTPQQNHRFMPFLTHC